MHQKTFRNLTVVVILAMFLAACSGGQGEPTSTLDPSLIYTAAAQTADARLTELVAQTPSATPVPATPTPDITQTVAVQTMIKQTQDAALTLTAQPSATATVPFSANELAVWVADVTILDGTDMTPGQTFVKTWRLQNNGSSTWTTDYDLVFVSGEQMGTTTEVAMITPVAPGQQVDVSVTLTAPSVLGTYTGYWKMRNASGAFFNFAVTVVIDVVGTAATTTTGSSSAATATLTPTLSSNPITSLTMSVDPPAFIGACPHIFTFSANFTLTQAATLTYQLEGHSDTAGFTFNLPAAQTQAFSPGTYSLSFPLEFSSSGSGWVLLHITAPVNMSSNQAAFSLTCSP